MADEAAPGVELGEFCVQDLGVVVFGVLEGLQDLLELFLD